jgi:thioredoxin-like negative regulator of GroEL
MTTDANGMTPLPNHLDFEAMLRPRRPTEDGFLGTYDMWVVVSFSAKWCGPCQRLDKKSIVKATPNVHWYAVDVDENDTTLGYCNCRSIPAFVILKDGLFLDKKEGANSAQDVLDWLASKGVPVKY